MATDDETAKQPHVIGDAPAAVEGIAPGHPRDAVEEIVTDDYRDRDLDPLLLGPTALSTAPSGAMVGDDLAAVGAQATAVGGVAQQV